MQVYPQQITPGESFDLFYFLRNPTDSTTYYCRSVIYDVRTGEALATVSLAATSTNPHLFSTIVQAPPDSSGYGRNIVAVASLYTDSGYTTKSTDYEEQEQYFLIKAPQIFGGGGGIDMRELGQLFQDHLDASLAKLPKPEKIRMPDMSFVQPLFGAIGVLQREINRVPKDALDLTGVYDRMDTIDQHLAAGHAGLHDAITSIPPPDLTPVNDAAGQMTGAIGPMREEMRKALSLFISEYEKATQSYAKDALAIFEKTIREVATKSGITLSLGSPPQHQPQQEQNAPGLDVSHLMV